MITNHIFSYNTLTVLYLVFVHLVLLCFESAKTHPKMIMRAGAAQPPIMLHPSKYRNVLCRVPSYHLKGSKFVRKSVMSKYRQQNKKI